ncbi:hypothetical protein Peur_061043 [Populus x canadensis]
MWRSLHPFSRREETKSNMLVISLLRDVFVCTYTEQLASCENLASQPNPSYKQIRSDEEACHEMMGFEHDL